MKKIFFTACLALVPSIGAMAGREQLPEATEPVALVRAYFKASTESARAELAKRIASHREYRASRLGDWLHRGATFAEQTPGLQDFSVEIGGGLSRRVFLLVP